VAGWDAENQRWVEDPPPGMPPPLDMPPPISATVPPPLGGPPRGNSSRRALIVAFVTVLLCAGAGVGLWTLVDGGGDGSDAHNRPPDVTVSVPTSPTDPDTTGGSDGTDGGNGGSDTTGGVATEPPAGFVRVQDPAGFTLDVPESWQRSTRGASVYYKTQDGESLIQVFTLNGPETTPYESLAATESTVSNHDQYQLIGLEPVDDQAADATELEYTYLRDNGVTRHVIDRAFTGPDSVQYALLVAGPDTDWSTHLQVFQVLRDSFCPDGYCGG
jgi:hypothetical protein